MKKVKEGTVAFDDIHDKVRQHDAKAPTRTTQDLLNDLQFLMTTVYVSINCRAPEYRATCLRMRTCTSLEVLWAHRT